jgi:hypothetical protein
MLGEPSSRRILSGEDVGTRLEHLMQLQDYWSTCYGILTTPNTFHTSLEKARAVSLEIALDLLQHYIEAGHDTVSLAKEINKLPKNPKEIL